MLGTIGRLVPPEVDRRIEVEILSQDKYVYSNQKMEEFHLESREVWRGAKEWWGW